MATPQLPGVVDVSLDVLIVNGVEIPVSGQDVFFNITFPSRGTMVATNGGQAIWSRSPDNTAKIDVICSQASLANKRLAAVLADLGGMQTTPVSVRAVKTTTGSSITSPFGWISQPAPIVGQRTDADVTWTIDVGNVQPAWGTAVVG